VSNTTSVWWTEGADLVAHFGFFSDLQDCKISLFWIPVCLLFTTPVSVKWNGFTGSMKNMTAYCEVILLKIETILVSQNGSEC